MARVTLVVGTGWQSTMGCYMLARRAILGQASVEPRWGLGSVENTGIWAGLKTRAWADEKGEESSSGEEEDRRGRKSPGRALGAEAGSLASSRVAGSGLGCARNLAGEV